MITVGWAEWLALPELDIPYVAAKIDTGAKSSCLHAFAVEPYKKGTEQWLRFGVHPVIGNDDIEIWRELPVVDRRVVTSSSGHGEERWVVKTPVEVGNREWQAEFTLTNRDNLQFRVLLGREAMAGRVMVNPGQKWLLGKPSKQQLSRFQARCTKAAD